ncbi:MAG: response regulator, partial [Draconibacterium sp.]|nr:response regulator [Draconibacterium sp.]
DASHVQIEISDDGAGINQKKLIKKALKQNIISEGEVENLSNEDINNLILKSGVSTASIITDISGRGLGMAIVEQNVEKLGGKIAIKSKKGKGSTFSISVPTSIARSQGLLVKVNKRKYIVPISNIQETLRFNVSNIKMVENQETIQYMGRTLPIVKLGNILGISHSEDNKNDFITIVVIESLNQQIGIIIDEIENEQEVLFKPFNYPIKKLKNVAGVSLLGTGEICPILNNQDLIRSALQLRAESISASESSDESTKDQKSILIAEDSITSRLFLKNILESAGYKVKAVVDGKEALTSLKQQQFDLLVSDVEMPRMNGFELTEAVRNEESLSDLPVILVTSLSNREHQERGIDAGANAYIVKSSFEQSNLLGVVNRLI